MLGNKKVELYLDKAKDKGSHFSELGTTWIILKEAGSKVKATGVEVIFCGRGQGDPPAGHSFPWCRKVGQI